MSFPLPYLHLFASSLTPIPAQNNTLLLPPLHFSLTEEAVEPANTGFIDAISFADLDNLMTNYDGVISEDGFMVVSFLENNVYKVCELHR